MADRHHSVARRWALAGTLLAVAIGCLVACAPATAADPLDKLGTSLNWIPDDAAFYSSSLRNGEQIQAIAKSRAWAAVMAMPAVQEGLKQLGAATQSGEYAEQFKAFRENPEVQKALKLLADMFSHETFVYGDQSTVDLIDLVQRLMSTMRYGQLVSQMTGEGAEAMNPGLLVLSGLAQNIELLKVPNVIIGFRVKDRQLAQEELTKLEGIINVGLMFVPQLASQWKRTNVAGNEYMTLTLDGAMIPWDQIPLDEAREHELHKGDVDKVVEHVKKLKKVIALGLRDDYLLLFVGPSTERLAQLGKGKSLAGRTEFKPLEKYVDQRLLSIGYISQKAAVTLLDNTREIKQILGVVDQVLPKVDLPADKKAQIRKDADELAKDITHAATKPGAMMSFNFIAERGMEGYSYSWGDFREFDASKALSLLEHIGGKPLLAVVARGRGSVQEYDVLVKWARKAYGYFQEFAVPHIPPEGRDKYDKAVELFMPLVKRLDAANRTLIEATADGQFGVILDAKLKSRQFCQAMPPTDRPMPMIEPAMVIGVSKPELMRKAMGEYRQIFNEAVDAIRKIVPDPSEIPPLSIPSPKETKIDSGTLYTYTLPEQWGVTKDIVISLGLSDTVGVVAATTNHAGRLLASAPPAAGGVLADANRPRAVAVSFDWAGLVDAATPWIEYGVKQAVGEETQKAKPPKAKRKVKKADAKADGPQSTAKKAEPAKSEATKAVAAKPDKAAILPQVRTALKVLKVIPSVTSECYLEDGTLVTHTLVEVRDID
jgi:hypothetical protein